jgi:D-lactate dehydrogenase
VVNHLGIDLGHDPATMLARLAAGTSPRPLLVNAPHPPRLRGARARVEADTPARFNADPTRLFEASGSAGKVMVLALRLDTFARDERTATFTSAPMIRRGWPGCGGGC